MSTPVTPRKPIPKHAVKTAEVLHATENHSLHEEEHFEEASEKWLVSYADLMTLLFGFFVLMYSMSNVDQKKFAEAAQSASERFGGEYQDPTEAVNRAIAKEIKSIPGAAGEIEVKKGLLGIEVNFRGKVLFDSGQSALNPKGQELLGKLAAQIQKLGKEFSVRVEGHTDDVPISTPQFPSNWELSASRAIEVIKIFRAAGIEGKRLEAIGFADTRPIAENRSPAGEAKPDNMSLNRRVMIRIQKGFPQ